MNAKEKRDLESELVVMGLAGLDANGEPSGELVQQLADLVSAWPLNRHDYLRDLLNECDADKRVEMYEAIAPKLKFKALPFSSYEARIMERGGAMVSQRQARVEGESPRVYEVGGQQFVVVQPVHASHCIITLTCHNCQGEQKFLAKTPVSAMTDARKAGWARDPGVNKELCPLCCTKSN